MSKSSVLRSLTDSYEEDKNAYMIYEHSVQIWLCRIRFAHARWFFGLLGALVDFKMVAGKQTHHEHLRNIPGTLGPKLLIASTALRAYRNRHLGTLMRCCVAWEPVGKCFDQCSFECIDFHGLSQIIASFTWEELQNEKQEYVTFPGRRWKKQRLGEMQTPCSCLAYQEIDALSPRSYR